MLWFYISCNRKGQYIYHYDHDDDDDSIWATLAILLSIWAVYTGIFHLLDWLTFDTVPWYVEPFTIIPVVAFSALVLEYGANPLHWWPLCWGTRVRLKADIEIDEKDLRRLGGPLNVYKEDYETLRFRRKRDAFAFMMFRNL